MDVSDECKQKFLEHIAKSNCRFIIFKIENQEAVVEKLGIPDEAYVDFTASQPASERRITIFNFDFTTDQNFQKSNFFFSVHGRDKVVYASSEDRFKSQLDGIQVELQATDSSEMSLDIVKGRTL
ncbi:actin-depolymerizing factor 7-like [Quercus robur]|uniref:actin-depolymerizing factor 7-like n=1 Tax=Quercus robur TaxID=38942 RepID=UPI002162DA67|nr:actin-depolymerizing factor 7-like [Quercus robur]